MPLLLIPVFPQGARGCFLVQVLESWKSEDGLWFSWNNSHEYHHFGGKKLSLAISYSGCSSWFFLLLLGVESMGFFMGWPLVCTGQLLGSASPGLGGKALSAPAVTQKCWFLGPAVDSPAIAAFVLPLIKFLGAQGLWNSLEMSFPSSANKPLLDFVRWELQGLTLRSQEMRTANKEPRW